MKADQIHLVLFYCGLRTGHFGQGAFISRLLPFFKSQPGVSITMIKTDVDSLSGVSVQEENGIRIIAIPHSPNGPMLTGENHPLQHAYARQVIGTIYSYLKDEANLLFWVNSIDYLNVAVELKQVFGGSKLMYVHHSFSWKYLLNIQDEVFAKEWKRRNTAFHPQAFEMTRCQQQLAQLSDIVITVTDHARAFFSNVLKIPARKITTIYNGSPLPGPSLENKRSLRSRYGFSQAEKIILFSGRVTHDKGYPDLLRAFKNLASKHKQLRLVVLGVGPIFDHCRLVEPYWSKVIYTGALQPYQVNEFYRLADVGVIPSLHEQCSFTAIEMRLHKLPMILSGVDGLDELFIHEEDALKLTIRLNTRGEKELDPNQLAGYIQQMLTDRPLATRLARNAYRKGKKKFTEKVMWNQYQKVLASLAYPVNHAQESVALVNNNQPFQVAEL